MRNPEIVLENLHEKAKNENYKFERLYRNLYNEDFYLLAYQNIYSNKGALTKGVDNKTLDGFGLKRIKNLIQSLKDHSYKPSPARRTYIPKANGKKRPLGISSSNDKLVQEVMKMILESIYEPNFSKHSHGFRPNRSCHTALKQVQNNFTGVVWFVEGDIKSFFDVIDHHTLINILRKRIKDEYFIALVWKMLKAGYMEEWEFNKTHSGCPQGNGCSPILANIYLNEFDRFMSEYKQKFDTGNAKTHNQEYTKSMWLHTKAKNHYKSEWHIMNDEEKKVAIKEVKMLRRDFLSIPSKEPMDNKYKRIQYVRYCDDFLIGVIGSKGDACKVKEDITEFLNEQLKLELSKEKTLITSGKNIARFLGYDITICHDMATKKTKKGQSRVYFGKVKLYLPFEKWRDKLLEYNILKIKKDKNGKEIWKPLQRNSYFSLDPAEIVSRYNAQIRGLYNYYRLASNVSVLQKFYYVMEYSMYKTFAGKYRITMTKAKLKHTRNKVFSVPYLTKSGTKKIDFHKGGFTRIITPLYGEVDTQAEYQKRNKQKEIFRRIKKSTCELCGKENISPIVHMVDKVKDLKGTEHWEKVMIEKRRKTLIVCDRCYCEINM